MQIVKSNQTGLLSVVFTLQLLSLLVYMNTNIVNVGEAGTALPLLLAYVSLSMVVFLTFWFKKKLYLRLHLLFFLLLVAWIALRISIDLGDIEYLKQVTIATTGGMLLFYCLGAFLSLSYQAVIMPSNRVTIAKFVILIFSILMIWMLYNFSQRMHQSLFYVTGVDGAYQRPGNFLSISFVTVSYLYLILVLKRIGQSSSALGGFFWLVVYTLSTLMALVGSQLFGSNSATAVIFGVYLITLVVTLVSTKKSIWLNYLNRSLALPWSKRLVKQLSMMATVGLLLFSGLLILAITATDFDITSLRLFGFGTGSNTSLLSRVSILMESGTAQLGYAPLLGNVNVACLTTGDAGRTLHSFFLNVMASLGLVGLAIVLILFTYVFMQLNREVKATVIRSGLHSYQVNMVALYSIFILLYILFFANLATSFSWAVLWFTLGFISKPFGFR